MPRLEEAVTISPGQSSGAKAEERHPGYMFSSVSCASCKDSYILIALCSCPYRALDGCMLGYPGRCPGLMVTASSRRGIASCARTLSSTPSETAGSYIANEVRAPSPTLSEKAGSYIVNLSSNDRFEHKRSTKASALGASSLRERRR